MTLSRAELRTGQIVFVSIAASLALVDLFVTDVPARLPLLSMLMVTALGNAYQKACRWDSLPLPPEVRPWHSVLDVADWLALGVLGLGLIFGNLLIAGLGFAALLALIAIFYWQRRSIAAVASAGSLPNA